jgi:hypothetical protein
VVYRGKEYASLQGCYIAADFYSGVFYKIIPNGANAWTVGTQTLSPNGIVDFGETENGEVYAVSNTRNSVLRIILTGTTATTNVQLNNSLATIYPSLISNRIVLVDLHQISSSYQFFELMDLKGNMVLRTELNKQTGTISIPLSQNLASGIYVAKVSSSLGVVVQKIYIQQ